MPNDDFAVICPYYHKALGNSLFCEGFSCDGTIPVAETFMKQNFPDRASRNRCMRHYCASFRYPDCRIARLNRAKYQK